MRRIAKLFVFCLALSSVLFAADYRFVKIDFPGASASIAAGINARGDIVGRYDDANGVTHGFLLHKGVYSTINFPNASFTAARGINARGDIVGRVVEANGNEHGYLLRDGQFTQIDYPGAAATTARGINNAGEITGRHFDTVGNESGFIMQQDGSFKNIRVPASGSTDVWLAQDNGRVMVGDAVMGPDGALFGYIRTGPGKVQPLEVPGSGSFSCTAPRWINQRGDIAGLYVVATTAEDCYGSPPNMHGFLLRQSAYTVIDFPGAATTGVFGINDDGVMVGTYDDKQGNTHGFKAVPKNAQ